MHLNRSCRIILTMKNMTLSSLPLILIGCTIACSGFDFRCPVSSEWRFRSKTCRNRNLPHYYCLFDANNNVSIELCKDKNDFQGAGEQFVFRGNPDKQNCFDDRYQPIWFWTNGSSECILLKSQCQGTGLFVFGNGSTTEDRTCRCDHTRGYAFVAEPNNPCYCIPSQEDCSCYRKQCNKTSTLSFDYTCIPKDEPLVSSCNTSNESGYVEFQRPISKHVPDTRENFVNFNIVNYRYVPQIAVLVLTVIFVIIGVLGFLVIFCGICTPGVRCGHEVYYTSEDQTVQLDFCVVSFLRVSFEIVTANDVSQHIEPTHVDGKRKYYSFSVANVKYSDLGAFTCHVSNCFGTTQCHSKLLVEANPRFCVSLPFDVSIPEGEVVLIFEIPDEYNGIPVKSVSWKRQIKDDMVTVASTKESTIGSHKYRNVTLESPFLRIMNVTSDDAGKYSCYISIGQDEMSASIIIGPPTVTVVFQECLQSDGMEENVELRCVAKSENIAIKSVMWRKNVDGIITDILADINTDKYAGGSPDIPSLTIHRLDNNDKGSYVCEVTNTFGKSESQPIVLDQPLITTEEIFYNDNKQLRYMELRCRVSSNVRIKSLTWQKSTTYNVIAISSTTGIEKYAGGTADTPTLTIYKPDSDDAGTYTCNAINSCGTTQSAPFVIERPEIQIDDVSCYSEIGSPCTITCNVSSTLPITKVTWGRTTEGVETLVEVNANAKFQGATPENPSLTIMNVDTSDLGSYICFAANPVGTVESQPITLTNVKEIKKERKEAQEIRKRPDSVTVSPRLLLHKSVKENVKKVTDTRIDETDMDLNLQFAQAVLTDTQAADARKRARDLLEEEIRIVFVGKTGVGKSSTANTILGKDVFPSGAAFKSVTQKCMIEHTEYRGRKVQLIDTPGIFAEGDKKKETEEEIKRCIHLAAPGPHAILFVIEYGRFKQEDKDAITTFLDYFGEELKLFVIVVFTHVDKMKKDETIKEGLEDVGTLKDFLETCGHRYCKFNNVGSRNEKECHIDCLFALIDKMKTANDFLHFTDESIGRAEKRVQEKVKQVEREVREDCERKHSQEKKELLEKFKDTKTTEESVELIKKEYQQMQEALRLKYEKCIQDARENARKEYATEQFSDFVLQKQRGKRHSII